MEITKDLALAMLAGAKAIKEKLRREGGTAYVLDPFNDIGQKAEIDYTKAQSILANIASDAIANPEGKIVIDEKMERDSEGKLYTVGKCPACHCTIRKDEPSGEVCFCHNCGLKIRW